MSLKIEVDITQALSVLLQFGSAHGEEITAAITSDSDHWKACEFGSARGKRPWPNPGPRTTATSGRVRSTQAEDGFIRRHRAVFVGYLKAAALSHGPWTRENLLSACDEATQQAAALIRKTVPVDSGELRDSIKTTPAT
jgi:hypothetical protein